MTEATDSEITKRRLRWKCRRGMLELDLFLLDFFDKYYNTLNSEQISTFEVLLETEDTQLYSWFMQVEAPNDPALKAMVDQIIKS